MNMSKSNSLTKMSKFISKILRHKPEIIGISLDECGWANVQELISGINAAGRQHIDMSMLEEIVRTDEKQRYSFNEDRTKIRANQGHSIPVDLNLESQIPPDILYHGTGLQSVPSISRQGLLPMGRMYVHLSKDYETAVKVGQRHGRCCVYEVNTLQMAKDNYIFYQSANHVWLTEYIPVQYLRQMKI